MRAGRMAQFGGIGFRSFYGWRREIIAILFLPKHTVFDGWRSLRFQVACLLFHLLECPFLNHFAAMPAMSVYTSVSDQEIRQFLED